MSNVTNHSSHATSESCNPFPSTKKKQLQQQPEIVFNGHTFTAHAVTLSRPATSYYKEKPFEEEMNVNEKLKGIMYV